MLARRLVGALPLFVVVACTSASSDAERDEAGLAAACDRWVALMADRQITVAQILYDTHDVRVADPRSLSPAHRAAVTGAEKKVCLELVSLPGGAITPAWLDACRDAFAAERWGAMKGACAPPPGTLGDGAACTADLQCASLHCEGALQATCGTCAPRLPIGAPCARDCGAGLRCVMTPVPGAHSGPSACQDAWPAPAAPCVCPAGQRCTSTGCAPLPGPGQACSSGSDCVDGFYCDRGTCAPKKALGDACTLGIACPSGAYCTPDGSAQPRVCAQTKPDGASCTESYACAGGRCDESCSPRGRVCMGRDVDAPLAAPGEIALGANICAIGQSEGCAPCPPIAGEGEPCEEPAPGVPLTRFGGPVCVPYLKCVDGACRYAPRAACRGG